MDKIIIVAVLFTLLSAADVSAESQKIPALQRAPITGQVLLPKRELIFARGRLNSSHSPSIVCFPDGELFVVWYAAAPSSPDAVIWASRKPAGSAKWADPWIVNQTSGYANKNPVLYVGIDGTLRLFWANEKRLFDFTIDTIWTKTSPDRGRTWSEPQKIKTPIGFLPRTHPVRLEDGTVLLPLYVNWSTSSVLMASGDDGHTWDKYRYILFFFGIQPTIIQRSDLSLYALTRTGMWPRFSWQAISKDRGRTWICQWPSGVKNPGSSLEMIKLESGNVVLAFNNSRKDRSTMSLALSCDEGRTWPYSRAIDDEEGMIHTYPSIAQDKDGVIHVVYSYDSRENIAHFSTDEAWIKGLK